MQHPCTESRLSPEEIFTGKKSRHKLEHFHTSGCPIFVLKAAIQQGNKIAKWQLQSRLALYLGHSPNQAQTIPLVLNIWTGLCVATIPALHLSWPLHDNVVPAIQCASPIPEWVIQAMGGKLPWWETNSAGPVLAQPWMGGPQTCNTIRKDKTHEIHWWAWGKRDLFTLKDIRMVHVYQTRAMSTMHACCV